MTKLPESAALPELPLDVWKQIAQHEPFPNRARVAKTSRVMARAVRDSWNADHYFQCAGQPDKPADLRVAHRGIERDEPRPWLALARELRLAPTVPCRPLDLLPCQPQRALIALARQCTPADSWEVLKLSPVYEEALTKMFRSSEAEPFARRTQLTAQLVEAVEAADGASVARLLESGLPLPPRARKLAMLLWQVPGLTQSVVESLADQGRYDLLHDIFLSAEGPVRRGIGATTAFQTRPSLRAKLFERLRDRGVYLTSKTMMGHFAQLCSPEQCRELLHVTEPQPSTRILMNLGSSIHQHEERLGSLLPVWLRAGGDAAKALCEVRDLPHGVVQQLVSQLDAPPAAVLATFMAQSFVSRTDVDSVSFITDALLRLGARLPAQAFASFVKRHRDADGCAQSAAARVIGERFAFHGAVPAAPEPEPKKGFTWLNRRASQTMAQDATSRSPFAPPPSPSEYGRSTDDYWCAPGEF